MNVQREECLEISIVTWDALTKMASASDPLVRMWVVVKGLALYDCLTGCSNIESHDGSFYRVPSNARGYRWAVGLRDRVVHDAHIPTPEETALAIEVFHTRFLNHERAGTKPNPTIPDEFRHPINPLRLVLDWLELESLACLQNQPVRTMAVLLAYQKLETEPYCLVSRSQSRDIRNDAAHSIYDPSPEVAQLAVHAFFRASGKAR